MRPATKYSPPAAAPTPRDPARTWGTPGGVWGLGADGGGAERAGILGRSSGGVRLQCTTTPLLLPGSSLRGKKKEERVRNDNRNDGSRGRSLLHGQDMGKTQNYGTVLNNGRRLVAVGGGWRLVVLRGCPYGLSSVQKNRGS